MFFFNDSIRLSEETNEKLQRGEEKVYELINRPQKKFEPSIMIAGGICKYGLTNLILPEGPENECSYAQALYYYKEDIQKYKNKGVHYFEQDGATPHTSDNNKKLIKKLFGEEPLIQNPPNSPDLAYPIENILVYLKKQIKKEIQSH